MPEEASLERTIEVTNRQGVHARPASQLVKLAGQYSSALTVRREDTPDEEVNAKSIMGIMMLAAEQGTRLVFKSEGPDALALMDAVEELFRANFNEEQ